MKIDFLEGKKQDFIFSSITVLESEGLKMRNFDRQIIVNLKLAVCFIQYVLFV